MDTCYIYIGELFLELVQIQTKLVEQIKTHSTFNKFYNVNRLEGNNL
jgi:hypothetical protein